MSEPIEYTKIKIPAYVGMMSLVGIGSEKRPVSFGNYFDFAAPKEDVIKGNTYRCINMWAENLTDARQKFLSDNLVECIQILTEHGKYAVVIDERIPKEWLCDYPYFCGCHSIPKYILEPLCDYMGWDKNGRAQEYLDPHTYYAKQGAIYDEKTGIVKHQLKESSRKLKDNWTIEIANDINVVYDEGFFYAPYIPKEILNK